MKRLSFLIIVLLLFDSASFAQVGITTEGGAPDNSAMLHVSSTNKGFLPPRMTQAQIEVILSPANGLVVFCTTDNKFYVYISSAYAWKEILYGSGNITPACGSSITIYHVAGNVAPVTKIVTYNTVTNIPGATSKCWITSNLGADHQPSAKNDATEASAGWYWQFNRKQGFKHDGTTRTPGTAWITSIEENLEWAAASDPCNLELGAGWRLPTYTEYSNVITGGGWTNWDGPWDSALKLHAAGILHNSNGLLTLRGSYGFYWSSSQSNNTSSWRLYLYDTGCGMFTDQKAGGFTVRCLRN